jgi:hypothetical protein
MDLKKLFGATPFLKGMDSTTHWCIMMAITPLVMILLGQSKAPTSWVGLAYLALHVFGLLTAAAIVGWRDHRACTKKEASTGAGSLPPPESKT